MKNDRVLVRIVSSEKPELNAFSVNPNLEDVYLYHTYGKEVWYMVSSFAMYH